MTRSQQRHRARRRANQRLLTANAAARRLPPHGVMGCSSSTLVLYLGIPEVSGRPMREAVPEIHLTAASGSVRQRRSPSSPPSVYWIVRAVISTPYFPNSSPLPPSPCLLPGTCIIDCFFCALCQLFACGAVLQPTQWKFEVAGTLCSVHVLALTLQEGFLQCAPVRSAARQDKARLLYSYTIGWNRDQTYPLHFCTLCTP